MNHTTPSKMGSTVLLFGPQALSFSKESFQRLKSAIDSSPENAWMKDVVDELPDYVQRAAEQFPKIQMTPKAAMQPNLGAWLRNDTAEPPSGAENLPNALLTPLVVLDHLTQYTQYVRLAHVQGAPGSDEYGPQMRRVESLGFCTGLLTALAAASASSRSSFQRYGAVAVRLAALIGAAVDAEEMSGKRGTSRSFSTACRTRDQDLELNAILRDFPEAYISVNYDQYRATITTSARSATELHQRLRDAGIATTAIGLRGRFHYPGHLDAVQDLIALCDSSPELQFPDAGDAVIPIHSLSSGDIVTKGRLHHVALREILVEQSQWGQVFNEMSQASLASDQSILVSFGSEKCIPPSAMPRVGGQIVHMTQLHEAAPRLSAIKTPMSRFSDNDIAVVGMACKVAGADDVDEFWDLNCSGKSQHVEVPAERFTFDTHWRSVDPNRKWYGNFLKDHDAYDHKFFQKSPREAATQDPQQRLFLQSAYQAVEQSGYFNDSNADRNVGVYVGVCAADYEANIACYAPNAFSATGNLKSFIAGKISHYFGWHGPGLTIDTACSASAVAIHQACQAILTGECDAALAGGTNVMTSPIWFQNLAGATFLSPTGPCKPFDSSADGYCRGEGVACVFLKKMSKAVQDGDMIIGRIRSTAVQQNDNCTPIFVPNEPSLSSLFERALCKAGVQPADISLVEAHGTGTPVGDPAEYQSILKILGGTSLRSLPMPIGSVKGLIGHTECTSGVIALIRVLLMMHYETVPPQASFHTPSHRLNASPADMLEIRTKLTTWTGEQRTALINNYGASGSNASMIVGQSPYPRNTTSCDGVKHAFWMTGLDARSIRDYATRLRKFLAAQSDLTLSNLSFNMYRQSNRALSQGFIFSCSSIQELDEQLSEYTSGGGSATGTGKPPRRPVILCFGGQTSKQIGLDRAVYENTKLFQTHLDSCDAVLRKLGHASFYPNIFEKTDVSDPVRLQTMLFSIQYSCARSWMDSGIEPVAVVGHSFGELTALCISGVLPLKEALTGITARATLIKTSWGSDSGAMIAIEGDLKQLMTLLDDVAKSCPGEVPASIACFNGPTSFTCAGSTSAIDELDRIIAKGSGLRGKRLSVSNAFHSGLVDPLIPKLEGIGRDMHFSEAKLRWERATETSSSSKIGSHFLASHMRDPVFANHAFQRLHREYPSAIWLEAGSNSTITKMANKALGAPATSSFVDLNITSSSGQSKLTDAVLALWRSGLNISHWAHHHTQAQYYSPILLPPYQFERSRHWLELKKSNQGVEGDLPKGKTLAKEVPETLYTFFGYQDSGKSAARFKINTSNKRYVEMVSGHLIVQTAPICPATLEVDIVIEALLDLRPELRHGNLQPEVREVMNQAPICNDPARAVWLDLQSSATGANTWDWQIISSSAEGAAKMTHVKGEVIFRSTEDQTEFARYERLIGHQSCVGLLQDIAPDDVLQGRNLYKVFSEIVDYSEPYRGLQKLVGKGNMSAGRVVKAHSGQTWLDPHLSDCFSQVGGFWVNCMTDRPPSDMYIAAGFESWFRKPGSTIHRNDSPKISVWDVLAYHKRVSEKMYTTDIFIFDAADGVLCESILGIQYARISKTSMSKTLTKLTASTTNDTNIAAPPTISPPAPSVSQIQAVATPQKASIPHAVTEDKSQSGPKSQIVGVVIDILAELSGVGIDAIKPSTRLADIGIDSLVGMEMIHDLESKFECSLDVDQMAEVVIVNHVVQCVQSTLGIGSDGSGSDLESSSASGTQSPISGDSSVTSESDSETMHSKRALGDLQLPVSVVLDAFGETKKLTDQYITDSGCSGYMDTINPKQTQLCLALVCEAFQKLGCNLRAASLGQRLPRIAHAPQHDRLVRYLYDLLESEGRLINIEDDQLVRTAVSLPRSSEDILASMETSYPAHGCANRLAFFCGSRLVEVLEGKLDGVKLIFGNEEGRQLVSGLYGDTLLNKIFYNLMEEVLSRLISRIPRGSGPLKILEMGAGTGGTSKYLIPLLAKLDYPVEYTFTDLAPSFVAAARRRFKEYPFVKFRAHDIEQPPADDLIDTQHIVVASNAVHATHSLAVSLKNIRKALRPDGFLMMLEMTETLPWVDIIFGILEGWWLFDDGRTHAISPTMTWEQTLHATGYGHVDWTDGNLPENQIQRIIVAMASGQKCERLPTPPATQIRSTQDYHVAQRTAGINKYVEDSTAGFIMPTPTQTPPRCNDSKSHCILVTGATGSLGAHLLSDLVLRPDVSVVYCLNRVSRGTNAEQRQHQSLLDKELYLKPEHIKKLRIFESHTSQRHLGLSDDRYNDLARQVTIVIHNAWPMSGIRPLRGFEGQFSTMRNLIDLARDAASFARVVTFQFVSSIAVVGHYPLWTGNAHVPEDRVGVESVLPNGYGDAKYACELMLDHTLHKYPDKFRTMCVRLGQVSGSSKTGYWNSAEHLSFLIKSSETLRALPDFKGELSWTPVDTVAATLADLAVCDVTEQTASSRPYPIYHIDNPKRQTWEDMLPVLEEALSIPTTNRLPFSEWVRRVRRFPGSAEIDNPAKKLIDFLDESFQRMSCGGLLLNTEHTREHSSTLAAQGAVTADIAARYISYWKRTGFLSCNSP